MGTAIEQQVVESLQAEEIFHPGAELLLALEAEKVPLKFNAQIAFFNEHRLELNMPDHWWKLVPFEEAMPVRMTIYHQGGMYTLFGTIQKLMPERLPSLIITHENKIKRNQRRMFFRVKMDKPFLIAKVHLPEKECLRNIPATLSDISAGGIGFKSAVFLPQGSIVNTHDLFDGIFKDTVVKRHRMEIAWCRVQRPLGYRLGAGFLHASQREQDQMVQIVNQLQRIHLSKYYHIVGEKQTWGSIK